jgi:hypothetical protein
MPTTRLVRWSAAIAVILFASACGGGKSSHGTTLPPDQVTIASAEATQVLFDLVAAADKVDGSVDAGTSVPAAGTQLDGYWRLVEGTVKANAPDTFTSLQAAISQLSSAAAANNKSGADAARATIDSAVKAYQSANP